MQNKTQLFVHRTVTCRTHLNRVATRWGGSLGLMVLLVAVLMPTAIARAHAVWLERDGKGGVALFYGEYAEGSIEVAGGELDKISPVLFHADPASPLALTRGHDRLTATTDSNADLRAVESNLPPYRGRRSSTKYVFVTRAGRSETKAVTDCEIVPTEANGNTYVVMLHGKAVVDTSITVVTPEKWSKSFKSDDQGRVAIQFPGTPTKGLYLLEAYVSEDKAGGEGDGAYDKIGYVTTLTFVVE